tara:strand:- start:2093 stop:3235 length:1143 start_codon:yes stop_codon:yes gene_type:complete
MASAINHLGIRKRLGEFISREYAMNSERLSLLIGLENIRKFWENFKRMPGIFSHHFDHPAKEISAITPKFDRIRQHEGFIFDFQLIEIIVFMTKYFVSENEVLKKLPDNSVIKSKIGFTQELSLIFTTIIDEIAAMVNAYSILYLDKLLQSLIESRVTLNLMTNKEFIDRHLKELQTRFYLFRFVCIAFPNRMLFFNFTKKEFNRIAKQRKITTINKFNNFKDVFEELFQYYSQRLTAEIIELNNGKEPANQLTDRELILLNDKLQEISSFFFMLSQPDSGCYESATGERKTTIQQQDNKALEEAKRLAAETERLAQKTKDIARREREEAKRLAAEVERLKREKEAAAAQAALIAELEMVTNKLVKNSFLLFSLLVNLNS